jgi:hypothetical protein
VRPRLVVLLATLLIAGAASLPAQGAATLLDRVAAVLGAPRSLDGTALAASTAALEPALSWVRDHLLLLDQGVRLQILRGDATTEEADLAMRSWAEALVRRDPSVGLDPQLLAFHRAEFEAHLRAIEHAVAITTEWPDGADAATGYARAWSVLREAKAEYAASVARGAAPLRSLPQLEPVVFATAGKTAVKPGSSLFEGADQRVDRAIVAALARQLGTAPAGGATPPPA